MTTTCLAVKKQRKNHWNATPNKLKVQGFQSVAIVLTKKKTEICFFHQDNSRANEMVLGNEKSASSNT